MADELTPRDANPQVAASAHNRTEIDRIIAETDQAKTNSVELALEMAASGPAGSAGVVAQQVAALGQGFQFSPEQIEQGLKDIAQQLVNLDNRKRTIGLARDALKTAPSPDPASISHRDAATRSLSTAMATVDNHMTALKEFRGKLLAAKQNYLDQERVTADQWNRLAGGNG